MAKSLTAERLESFDIYVLTADLSDYTQIASEIDVPSSYTKFSYDISNYAGTMSRLAIVSVSKEKHYLFVDDVSCFVVNKPIIRTTAISVIAQTSGKSGGNVTDDGGATITERGVCWSTSEEPTISDSKTTDGTGTGAFTSSMTGLQANTKYYVRAYATNSKGTTYGEQVEFTTLEEPIVTEVTIGEGTLNLKHPIDNHWKYSYSQSIYLQSEINRPVQIEAIKYYYNGNSSWSNDIDIFMGAYVKKLL